MSSKWLLMLGIGSGATLAIMLNLFALRKNKKDKTSNSNEKDKESSSMEQYEQNSDPENPKEVGCRMNENDLVLADVDVCEPILDNVNNNDTLAVDEDEDSLDLSHHDMHCDDDIERWSDFSIEEELPLSRAQDHREHEHVNSGMDVLGIDAFANSEIPPPCELKKDEHDVVAETEATESNTVSGEKSKPSPPQNNAESERSVCQESYACFTEPDTETTAVDVVTAQGEDIAVLVNVTAKMSDEPDLDSFFAAILCELLDDVICRAEFPDPLGPEIIENESQQPLAIPEILIEDMVPDGKKEDPIQYENFAQALAQDLIVDAFGDLETNQAEVPIILENGLITDESFDRSDDILEVTEDPIENSLDVSYEDPDELFLVLRPPTEEPPKEAEALTIDSRLDESQDLAEDPMLNVVVLEESVCNQGSQETKMLDQINNPENEDQTDGIAQEDLDRLAILENEVATLQECVEVSEANAEAAQNELLKEKSRSEMLEHELEQQQAVWMVKISQEKELADGYKKNVDKLTEENAKERESFQINMAELQKSLQQKTDALKEKEESNSILRKEAMELLARSSRDRDELEQKSDSIRKEMVNAKKELKEKDEAFSKLEEKAEDLETRLEKKTHEAKKLVKEVKKLKRQLEDERLALQRNTRFNKIMDHIENID